MTANHRRDLLDMIDGLAKRIADLEGSRSLGAKPFICTSTTHPSSPTPGMPIYETDTGLEAFWSGTAWVYPPQLLYKVVVGASVSSVRLPASGSLPQVFTNLRVVASMKTDGSGANGYDPVSMRFNGVTTSSYGGASYWVTQGTSSVSATSASPATSMPVANSWNAHFGTGGRGIVTIDIPDYAATTNTKSFTSQSDATDGGAAGIFQSYAGTLAATPAVTSITMLPTGNFVSGSTFCVYGS